MFKSIRFISILALAVSINACVEDTTYSYTLFTNNTGHTISVRPITGGITGANSAFSLAPNTAVKVEGLSGGGKGSGASYASQISPFDSVLVTFDDTLQMVHYKKTLVGSSAIHYLFESPRNLYNNSNYSKASTDENKHSITVTYNYSFTEADYGDAK
jgi:tartrate dehydratase alpha subunit/fumarate hydratase class I-like protein